jgi:hypothetical protein
MAFLEVDALIVSIKVFKFSANLFPSDLQVRVCIESIATTDQLPA